MIVSIAHGVRVSVAWLLLLAAPWRRRRARRFALDSHSDARTL